MSHRVIQQEDSFDNLTHKEYVLSTHNDTKILNIRKVYNI